MIMPFLFFVIVLSLIFFISYISALVLADAGLPLITTLIVGNKNKSLLGYAR